MRLSVVDQSPQPVLHNGERQFDSMWTQLRVPGTWGWATAKCNIRPQPTYAGI